MILDVIFEDGLLFVAIRNIGEKPAYKVSVTFSEQIRGLEGTLDISALPLFGNIEFLAPGREIRTFLDTSASYFARGEPTSINADVSFRDASGRVHARTIRHQLEIYKSVGYTRRAVD